MLLSFKAVEDMKPLTAQSEYPQMIIQTNILDTGNGLRECAPTQPPQKNKIPCSNVLSERD